MSKMTIAQADDWVGVYIGDNLETEGHSVDAFDAVKIALAAGVTSVETRWCDLEWIHDRGDMPQQLSEVKWEEGSEAR